MKWKNILQSFNYILVILLLLSSLVIFYYTDFSDTLDGINNRLKDRRMEDYMTVEYDQDKREIYIKIDKK